MSTPIRKKRWGKNSTDSPFSNNDNSMEEDNENEIENDSDLIKKFVIDSQDKDEFIKEMARVQLLYSKYVQQGYPDLDSINKLMQLNFRMLGNFGNQKQENFSILKVNEDFTKLHPEIQKVPQSSDKKSCLKWTLNVIRLKEEWLKYMTLEQNKSLTIPQQKQLLFKSFKAIKQNIESNALDEAKSDGIVLINKVINKFITESKVSTSAYEQLSRNIVNYRFGADYQQNLDTVYDLFGKLGKLAAVIKDDQWNNIFKSDYFLTTTKRIKILTKICGKLQPTLYRNSKKGISYLQNLDENVRKALFQSDFDTLFKSQNPNVKKHSRQLIPNCLKNDKFKDTVKNLEVKLSFVKEAPTLSGSTALSDMELLRVFILLTPVVLYNISDPTQETLAQLFDMKVDDKFDNNSSPHDLSSTPHHETFALTSNTDEELLFSYNTLKSTPGYYCSTCKRSGNHPTYLHGRFGAVPQPHHKKNNRDYWKNAKDYQQRLRKYGVNWSLEDPHIPKPDGFAHSQRPFKKFRRDQSEIPPQTHVNSGRDAAFKSRGNSNYSSRSRGRGRNRGRGRGSRGRGSYHQQQGYSNRSNSRGPKNNNSGARQQNYSNNNNNNSCPHGCCHHDNSSNNNSNGDGNGNGKQNKKKGRGKKRHRNGKKVSSKDEKSP